MKDLEISDLIKQIENIILNKPISLPKGEGSSSEIEHLENVLKYLNSSWNEVNMLIRDMAKGNFDTPLPGRQNLLAGDAKELHSVFKHITWQSHQVTLGDYSQRIDYLGDFSSAFNEMIRQLEERENSLKENSKALTQSMNLITSIMEQHDIWIVVTGLVGERVLYNNGKDDNKLTENLKKSIRVNSHISTKQESIVKNTYADEEENLYYAISSYPLQWQGETAIAHYIVDTTVEEQERKQLNEIAYVDELTGVYNRRFGMDTIQMMLQEKFIFSLALIDLNSLKYVNDHLGHDVGDKYICTVTDIFKETIYEGDYIFRIGGDEFLLLMTSCKVHTMNEKLESINKYIKNISDDYEMSISFGITQVDEQDTRELSEILKEIDDLMYEHKRHQKKAKR